MRKKKKEKQAERASGRERARGGGGGKKMRKGDKDHLEFLNNYEKYISALQ